jgi:hypothetical protein
MPVTSLHTLFGVNVDNASAAAFFISQINQWGFDAGIQELIAASDGDVDPTFAAVGQQAPRLSFTTSKIATVLAQIGISGLAIAADVDEFGVEAYLQKVTEGGTRAGASSHIKLTIKEGILIPRSISASQNQMAQMAIDALATYDGTNNPVVIATGQSLAGTTGISEAFTVGPVWVNGAQINAVQSINVNFGIQEVLSYADGEVWPTHVFIMSRRPSITITSFDVAQLNTLTLSGAAQGSTDSHVYLRKISENGTRVADNTAEHIQFSMDDGRVSVTNIGASQDAPHVASLTLTPTYDGSNAIFAISTAIAITT